MRTQLRKLYHYVHRRIWDGDHLNLVKHFGGLPCDNIENLRAPPDNGDYNTDAPPSQEEPTSVLISVESFCERNPPWINVVLGAFVINAHIPIVV